MVLFFAYCPWPSPVRFAPIDCLYEARASASRVEFMQSGEPVKSALARAMPGLAQAIAFGIAYYAVSLLALLFRTDPECFAIFWPPNGLLLGVLIVASPRKREWFLAIAFFTCFFANLEKGAASSVALSLALINVIEPWLALWCWRRLRPGVVRLSSATDILVLFGGALVLCAITAVGGAVVAVHAMKMPDGPSVWLSFWLADAMGIMLVAPLILTWHDVGLRSIKWSRIAEALGSVALVAAASTVIFGWPRPGLHYVLSFSFPVIPLLLWVAMRFELRLTSAALLCVSLIAIWNTGRGRGPFADPSIPLTVQLLTVQFFLCILNLSMLLLAATVHQRLVALELLQASESRHRQITEAIAETIWVTAPDLSRVMYVSPAFEKTWGVPCSALYADPSMFVQSVHPDDRDRFVGHDWLSMSPSAHHDYRIVRPDGTIRWVQSQSFPVRDHDNAIIQLIGVTRDVTDANTANQAKQSLIDELRKALAEIKTLRGLVPICAWCKKIRDDAGFWQNLEEYLRQHTEANFSHGICPCCMSRQLVALEDSVGSTVEDNMSTRAERGDGT